MVENQLCNNNVYYFVGLYFLCGTVGRQVNHDIFYVHESRNIRIRVNICKEFTGNAPFPRVLFTIAEPRYNRTILSLCLSGLLSSTLRGVKILIPDNKGRVLEPNVLNLKFKDGKHGRSNTRVWCIMQPETFRKLY